MHSTKLLKNALLFLLAIAPAGESEDEQLSKYAQK